MYSSYVSEICTVIYHEVRYRYRESDELYLISDWLQSMLPTHSQLAMFTFTLVNNHNRISNGSLNQTQQPVNERPRTWRHSDARSDSLTRSLAAFMLVIVVRTIAAVEYLCSFSSQTIFSLTNIQFLFLWPILCLYIHVFWVFSALARTSQCISCTCMVFICTVHVYVFCR